MGKALYIAEKPSVAMEFARALKEQMTRHDGYQEGEHGVITWCVGHLVTMSYPEAYDEKYRRWSLATLPFLPDTFLYEVIPGVKKQFEIVKKLLLREDIGQIYVCTDSGREGEYIYRLVSQMAGVRGKEERRVWIDSQTEEEILRGIREAKPLSDYDHLSDAAYLRAKEDYLMGINFSRLLTLKYGNTISSYLGERYASIAVGRVMTCVLGMVVRREREIRAFVKKPFYRVLLSLNLPLKEGEHPGQITAEFRAVEGSAYFQSPLLYKENGFLKEADARALIASCRQILTDSSNPHPGMAQVLAISRKTEKKNPPLLYNLAELQNDCAKRFHISPDQTLQVVQELYEKKLVTYPRTDARVLSGAVAKVIDRNLNGLTRLEAAAPYARQILSEGKWRSIGKTRYVNDAQITDHYAIIPTGQGLSALGSLKGNAFGIYLMIVQRFLSIFYPPAQYQKVSLTAGIGKEQFFASERSLLQEGYLAVMKQSKAAEDEEQASSSLVQSLAKLRKGSFLPAEDLQVKEGETAPPKRYNSGSMILAMENAGQLIEDETLREQIKGSGIGTSATRAEILKKLVGNKYIALSKKTQVLSPTLRGEMIYDVVDQSIRPLLSAELTASWEKGLTGVAEGNITSQEYMEKLTGFIRRRTDAVLALGNQGQMRALYEKSAPYYTNAAARGTGAAALRKNKKGGSHGRRNLQNQKSV